MNIKRLLNSVSAQGRAGKRGFGLSRFDRDTGTLERMIADLILERDQLAAELDRLSAPSFDLDEVREAAARVEAADLVRATPDASEWLPAAEKFAEALPAEIERRQALHGEADKPWFPMCKRPSCPEIIGDGDAARGENFCWKHRGVR